MHRKKWWWILLAFIAGAMAVAALLFGSVHIPLAELLDALWGHRGGSYRVILLQVRLPQVLTAAAAGAGLATAGLLMQTIFHNPLAGPGVLGVTGGAALGVAIVMLAGTLWMPAWGTDLLIMAAALVGALVVLALIMLADRRLRDGVTLLILGLMVGYLCNALISVLQAASQAQPLKEYVLWGMGSFAGVTMERVPWLLALVMVGGIAALSCVKSLNALALGDEQARTMGVEVGWLRTKAIGLAGLLAGGITAFCGPVAFLGLAVPHVARAVVRTADHRVLMPATMLIGAALGMGADLLVRTLGSGTSLPLNAITSLLGAPVVLWVLIRGRKWMTR